MPQSLANVNMSTVRDRVTGAIATAATKTGVNFDYLYNQARVESSLKPDARAKTSSATGLFQFTRQTWLATVKHHGAGHGLAWAADAIEQGPDGRYTVNDATVRNTVLGLRDQPEAAAAMAAEFASDNGDFLNNRLNRAVEPVDLYLAHFLGSAGAAQFLEAHDADPTAAAAPLFASAAASNRQIFYRPDGVARSLGEIRSDFAAKLDRTAPEPSPTAYPPSVVITQSQATTARSLTQTPLSLRAIETMPARLSLDFARNAYQRLAGLGAS
jgi:Transglycosylase SLT domain